ncbi:MAG: cofactor assembly of complex C subunit B [Phormidesmis sp.]
MFFTDPARASTLLLTLLMVIGLVFFIRASTKDRIETAQFGAQQKAESLEQAVMKYFVARAYRPVNEPVAETDLEAEQPRTTTLVGMVSPSLFMAGFLSALAAVGFACLGLIMSLLFPVWGGWVMGLVAASPLAGVFYWRKSSRPETVVVKVEPDSAAPEFLSRLTVKGHRDELADLQRAFAEPELQAWAGLKKLGS